LAATFGLPPVSNTRMINDRDLVSQVLDGNREAFKLLIRQNERLVSHMVGRLIKNREEHEEICQDVFLKVYEKLNEFSFQSKLSTWIATIAYRHAINYLRKHKVAFSELPDEEAYSTRFVSDENPEKIVEEEDYDSYILTLVDQLPPQYKLVLTLYHLDGLNYEEVGTATGMPEGTVKNYLFRARTLLKEMVMKKMPQ
jgi:RNA polymerase sigma factor (sigma-70 family)